MPKRTFFNLPKEKQVVLMNAAKKEFSRVPLNEALVSNIVHSANISRGSFYQYFEDKEDAFFFLLDKYSKETYKTFITSLKENDGDLFATYIDLFCYMLNNFKNKENEDFFKNMFLHMNYKVKTKFTNKFNGEIYHNDLMAIYDLVNKKNLTSTNEHEFKQMIQTLTAITFQNLIYTYVIEFTEEEALNEYKSKLHLLKRGFYKRDTE